MGMTSPEKQDLRLRLKAQLQTCDLTAYVPDAIRTVESCESFKNASVILAYTPINSLEIPFMQALHATHSDKEWFFVDANATEPVFRNSHGVVYVGDFVLVCCLVPSLALDVLGNRLGKGGGGSAVAAGAVLDGEGGEGGAGAAVIAAVSGHSVSSK
jgi:5-formyltetrahydrofolate cyclo-ligase